MGGEETSNMCSYRCKVDSVLHRNRHGDALAIHCLSAWALFLSVFDAFVWDFHCDCQEQLTKILYMFFYEMPIVAKGLRNIFIIILGHYSHRWMSAIRRLPSYLCFPQHGETLGPIVDKAIMLSQTSLLAHNQPRITQMSWQAVLPLKTKTASLQRSSPRKAIFAFTHGPVHLFPFAELVSFFQKANEWITHAVLLDTIQCSEKRDNGNAWWQI